VKGRGHRNISPLGACLLAALALLAGPAFATAPAIGAPSKFIYELCDAQSAAVHAPYYSVSKDASVPIGLWENCGSPNGGLALWQYGESPPTAAYITVWVPATPGGFVEAETITAEASGLFPGNQGGTGVYDIGWPASGTTQARTFYIRRDFDPSGNNAGHFNIALTCNGACGYGPTIRARDIAVLEVDPHPPTIVGPSGSLLAPVIVRGHQELAAEAKDEGGGVTKLELLVNGILAGAPAIAACQVGQVSNLSYRGIAALTPTPCPPSLKNVWSLDTGVPPFQNGSNSVQVCASDFATVGEASKTCSPPQTVTVDNSCSESPVAGGEQLSAEFARTQSEEVVVPFNATAKVVGALASTAGDPISGATICVQMETQGSPRGMVPVGTATTDANGHFTYSVNGGPNRKVLIGYRHNSFEVARTMSYRAHVRPTIELSAGKVRNGGEILIEGKLPGGHRAARRVVVLQAAALHSKKWFPFRETTTGAKGHYHAKYTFDATSRTTTYRIRASVPQQGDYLYDAGHSKPALVEVRAGKKARR